MLFGNRNRSRMVDSMYYNQLPSSIRVQLEALKSLDRYTKKHIEEVPIYAYKICRQLGIHGQRLDFIMTAAYLHDVGKIFIPPRVLQKQGKLTDEEFDIMKSHSAKGYELCMSLEDIRPYASTVRGHHESLDGSGYPDRLVGSQISYETRIIKVADVYSALSSKRQYKEAFSTKQIIEIMYKDVDNHKMDSEIVYALLRVVTKEKIQELYDLKRNIRVYKKQLKYTRNVYELLQYYAQMKLNSYEVMELIKNNRELYNIIDINLEDIKDANDLYNKLNVNIKQLETKVNSYDSIKNEIKELEEYSKKVMDKM